MDLLQTLLVYMSLVFATSVQTAPEPSVIPETPDYALYPMDMDSHNAPETYVFYAEEACAAVADAIENSYVHDGSGGKIHMHREPGMMHCYASAPVFKESRRDFNRQIALLQQL